ncbi:MAG: hypothetical protein JWN39_897, partial [Ilumatobacteraceae bacterium]|nr:hypothetical protein [Ilumatobacteraceae bacterium]
MIARRRTRTLAALATVGLAALAACSSDTKSASSIPLSTAGLTTTTVASVPASTPASTTGSAPVSSGAPAATTADTPAATTPPLSSSAVAPTPTAPIDPATLAFTAVGEISHPLDLTFRAGDDALYVVSQDGFVVAMRDGVVDDTKLLDISADITTGGERGLLGLTFSTDGSHAYVDYTNAHGDTEITEYAVGADGVFDPASKRLLLEIDQPFPNH